MAETVPKKETTTDMALVYSRSEDGKSYGIIRHRDDEIQLGTLRHLEEGKPINGELVRLKPRPEAPLLFDIETQDGVTPDRASDRGTTGPAKVATPMYRDGWDAIWSAKRGSNALN